MFFSQTSKFFDCFVVVTFFACNFSDFSTAFVDEAGEVSVFITHDFFTVVELSVYVLS